MKAMNKSAAFHWMSAQAKQHKAPEMCAHIATPNFVQNMPLARGNNLGYGGKIGTRHLNWYWGANTSHTSGWASWTQRLNELAWCSKTTQA